jgi:hypothetical protein
VTSPAPSEESTRDYLPSEILKLCWLIVIPNKCDGRLDLDFVVVQLAKFNLKSAFMIPTLQPCKVSRFGRVVEERELSFGGCLGPFSRVKL